MKKLLTAREVHTRMITLLPRQALRVDMMTIESAYLRWIAPVRRETQTVHPSPEARRKVYPDA